MRRTPALIEPALARLRRDLREADFTVDALERAWGVDAAAALHRGHRAPARRRLERSELAGSPLAVLASLFVVGVPQPRDSAAAALRETGLDAAEELGLIDLVGEHAVPLVDLRPYSFRDDRGLVDWWIASDQGELALGAALPDDHVLGVGGASLTLAGLLMPGSGGRVLDLGTGCGIQAMHASRWADHVVATDLSTRALAFARVNATLNGIESIEFRHGSLFEPVVGERFDRIVSNPPFVITPRREGVPEYEYRDGGLVGDALLEGIVREVGEHLVGGGVAQLLGNWEHRGGVDGLDRVAEWSEGLDSWVVERDEQSPSEYAETWIRDGGTKPGTDEFDRLHAAWLDDFADRAVERIGFGYLLLRRPVGQQSLRRFERQHGAIGDGGALGHHLATSLAAHDALVALGDEGLLRARPTVAADVTEERHHLPGEDSPSAIVLRQGGGFKRAMSVDPALAGLVGASDGELSVAAICSALAEVLEVDEPRLRSSLLPRVRELVVDGVLVL